MVLNPTMHSHSTFAPHNIASVEYKGGLPVSPKADSNRATIIKLWL